MNTFEHQVSPPAGFYLQDARSCTGNDMMWWAQDGNGYTSNIDKAHVYSLEDAMRQFEMRGFDMPWPKGYIDGLTHPAVDLQYLKQEDVSAVQDELFYVNLTNQMVGNDAMWIATCGRSSNLSDAKLFTRAQAEEACKVHLFGFAWPKSYIDGKARMVMNVERADRKDASKACGQDLPKRVFDKSVRERLRCAGCSRFMSQADFWTGECNNCGADSRP